MTAGSWARRAFALRRQPEVALEAVSPRSWQGALDVVPAVAPAPVRVERRALVEVQEVTQRFRSRVALDRFSMAIHEGTVLGILGPNGAGKTTLIHLVTGLTRPASGAVRWRGEALASPFPREVRRRIGLVTQETALYDELTVRQNLRFAADLFGVEPRDRRIADVLELVGLTARAKDRAGSLSGGMQRRLALGRALLHDPELAGEGRYEEGQAYAQIVGPASTPRWTSRAVEVRVDATGAIELERAVLAPEPGTSARGSITLAGRAACAA